MPVLFLLEIYYYDTPDHCTWQETRTVVTRILCIRGSGERYRDTLVHHYHLKVSVFAVSRICAISGSERRSHGPRKHLLFRTFRFRTKAKIAIRKMEERFCGPARL